MVTRLRKGRYLEMTIYPTRYQARKHAKYGDMVVKVKGGYILMDTREYYTWKAEMEKNNMTIKECAYKIDTFASYLEVCGITNDEEIKSAARYQLDCIRMGDENGRWCDAPDKDKRALREFVRKYC